MKPIFKFLRLFAVAAILLPSNVKSQTPRQFSIQLSGSSEVPTNATWSTGRGLLSLYGHTLYYEVGVLGLANWSAFIHGPAGPGTNGVLIAQFPSRGCSTPLPPFPGGCVWVGNLVLTDDQVTALTNGLLYVRIEETYLSAVRGQIVPDQDWDFVTDAQDRCPNTPVCDPWDRPTPNCPGWYTPNIDSRGCLLDQLPSMCPCENSKNHGQYVSCMNEAVAGFVREGFLTEAQGKELLKTAAHSDCGKKR